MFKREDIKAGMVCEVEEWGIRDLVMITYNNRGELCFSGERIWRKLADVDNDNLTYGSLDPTQNKFLKVYDRAKNRNAHKLSTEGRELLWERTEEKPKANPKSLTLEEVEKLLGYPVEIVTTTPPTDEPTDKPSVDVEKMRDELKDYCIGRWCHRDNCPLKGDACRCSMGVSFKSKEIDDTYKMSDDEIIAAYNIVFPDKAVEDKPHKYKVGDKVVITTDKYKCAGTNAKLIFIEGDDYNGDLKYKVFSEKYNNDLWLSECDIKPYKEV